MVPAPLVGSALTSETRHNISRWVQRLLTELPSGQALAEKTAVPTQFGKDCRPAASGTQDVPAAAKITSTSTCVVCLDEDASHILAPCGHRCVCATCSFLVLHGECPLCRSCVESVVGRVWNC
eukprot:3509061-Prymnesium_polylepis.1